MLLDGGEQQQAEAEPAEAWERDVGCSQTHADRYQLKTVETAYFFPKVQIV
jgi:hypothetical protein